MSKVETEILIQSAYQPLVWKRYIDNTFSLWTINRNKIVEFIEQANNHYPTIKFTAKVSKMGTTFLIFSKSERLKKSRVSSRYAPTKTFQYIYFTSSQQPAVINGFIKFKKRL